MLDLIVNRPIFIICDLLIYICLARTYEALKITVCSRRKHHIHLQIICKIKVPGSLIFCRKQALEIFLYVKSICAEELHKASVRFILLIMMIQNQHPFITQHGRHF